jgi:C_GCAxxG_C_C family probable redox protein
MLLAVGGHILGDLEPQSVRMATGFSGGVGGTHQEMCGALSGGVLVIGGWLGRESADEDPDPACDLVAHYRECFLATLGDTQCARLRELVEAPDGLGSCDRLVEVAAAVLLEVLEPLSGADA